MVVATDEADTAAAVFSSGITAPHEGLLRAEALFTMFIPKIDVFDGFFRCRYGSGEWVAAIALILGGEAHVVVEFIVGGDGLFESMGNGVAFSCSHVGNPMGVHGPTCFHVAADPGFEVFFTHFFGWVNAVVHEHDAHAGFDFLIQKLDLIAKATASVGVDNAGVNTLEDGFILRPAIPVDLGIYIEATLIEGIGKQHAACTEFMFTVGVAGWASEEEDFFLSVGWRKTEK